MRDEVVVAVLHVLCSDNYLWSNSCMYHITWIGSGQESIMKNVVEKIHLSFLANMYKPVCKSVKEAKFSIFWSVLCERRGWRWIWCDDTMFTVCELKPRVFCLVCIPSLAVKLTWLLAALVVFVPCCVINFPFPLWAFLLSFISSSSFSLSHFALIYVLVLLCISSVLYKTSSNAFMFYI